MTKYYLNTDINKTYLQKQKNTCGCMFVSYMLKCSNMQCKARGYMFLNDQAAFLPDRYRYYE